MSANFCDQCGAKFESAVAFCPSCGKQTGSAAPSPSSSETPSPKSAVTALLLCIFLGALGAHRFYTRKYGTAILMLLTGGGFGIWALVDLILIATCQFRDKDNHPLIFVQGKTSGAALAFKIIGCLIVSIIVYVSLLIAFVFYATSGITDTVRNQLTTLQSGDLNKAYYSFTSKDFQKETSLEDFKSFVNAYPALKNNQSASFSSREVSNGEGHLKGSVQAKDGSVTFIEYRLIKEANGWKILQIQVITPAPGVEVEHPASESQPTAAVNDNAAWQSYSDPKFNFTINYPAQWEYEKPKPNSIMFSGKKGTASYYSAVIIQAIPEKEAGGAYETTTEAVDDLKKQITDQTTDVKIQDGDAVTLPTNPKEFKGDSFLATYTYKGVAMKKLQFVITKDDGKYIYTYGFTAPAKEYAQDLSVAKKMFDSLTLND